MASFPSVDDPQPDPKSVPLPAPPPEAMPGSLFVPKLPEITPLVVPGFKLRLPKPAWWKRPGVWIGPLFLVLVSLVALVVWQLRRDRLPPVDDRLPTIVVDAGHGGHDSGALGNGLCEKILTLDTALRLERQLRLRGFPVVLTRRDDSFVELYDRSQVANALPRAIFVSVHYNDNTTSSGDGVETFYAAQKAGAPPVPISPVSLEAAPSPCSVLAQDVQSSLVTTLGVSDRGAKPRQLAVVRYARCPAVLVEGGFINNPAEARKLAMPEYRENIAIAIANGIAAFQQQRDGAKPDPSLATVTHPQ